MKKTIISIVTLVLLTGTITGCGVSSEDYSTLETERDQLAIERDNLNSTLQNLQTERDYLNSTLQDLEEVYLLKGFSTVASFKDWISQHVQPSTTYFNDAFLAAVKVQEAAEADGYLMGISLDIDNWSSGEDAIIGVTSFVGNELYWWFVEDAELYFALDLKR